MSPFTLLLLRNIDYWMSPRERKNSGALAELNKANRCADNLRISWPEFVAENIGIRMYRGTFTR